MWSIGNIIQRYLEKLELKKKLQWLYMACVMIPLVLTDGIILFNLFSSEQVQVQQEMEDQAEAVRYYLLSTMEQASFMADSIAANGQIRDFLDRKYPTALSYVSEYQKMMTNHFFVNSGGVNTMTVTVYADNYTIISGGEFGKIADIRKEEWYKKAEKSEKDSLLMFSYDNWRSPVTDANRRILYVRKMNSAAEGSCQKLIRIEINYSKVTRDIDGMNFELPVYVCRDGKVLLSNMKENLLTRPFSEFRLHDRVGYQKDITMYGDTYQIYVLKKEDQLWTQIKKNAPLILLLLVINLCLPYALMTQIERSITVRIKKLEEVFDSVDSERLQKISNVQGEDEIALLMRNYNRMADRTNELIQTVYKDKLKEQEMSIAKKNAELLALYGQINPHFMFNALESIRMHSILKQEYETADMVEKLAIMERQNVDWGEDNIEISKEMEFVKAYLGLQKYRFGDRLSYSLEVEDGCETLLIPKLTIVTFVENACVHGIESKTASGWIFVRIHKEGHEICIEVEDTGKGMPPEVMADIRDRMENADMSRLMKKGRVGILNACLRLKMVTDEEVKFSVESEEMVGTIIQIRIPIAKLMQLEK